MYLKNRFLLLVLAFAAILQFVVPVYAELPQANNVRASGMQRLDPGKLRQEWEEKVNALDRHSKSIASAKLNILINLLNGVNAYGIRSEYRRLSSLPDRYSDLAEFDKFEIQAFVVRSIREGHRALETILMTKPPRYVGDMPLELFLAVNSKGGILVLFDSYHLTSDLVAKNALLEVIKSALASCCCEPELGEEFIGCSEKWYRRNSKKLKINQGYSPHSAFQDSRGLYVCTRPQHGP